MLVATSGGDMYDGKEDDMDDDVDGDMKDYRGLR